MKGICYYRYMDKLSNDIIENSKVVFPEELMVIINELNTNSLISKESLVYELSEKLIIEVMKEYEQNKNPNHLDIINRIILDAFMNPRYFKNKLTLNEINVL